MRSPRKRRPSPPSTPAAALVDSLPRITACLRALDVPEQEIRDLTHNVVVTACAARERYDPQAGSEAAWLLGIARMTAKCARRKAVRQGTEPVNYEALAGPEQVSPHELLRAREARELLERMLARLSPQRRAVIEAKHLAGRSFHEIAEEMGLPFETVRKMERMGWEELEREARRIRARARHRKQDGLPMLLPLLPRRSSAAVPMLVGALGGALITAILLLSPVNQLTGAALPHLTAPAVAGATPGAAAAAAPGTVTAAATATATSSAAAAAPAAATATAPAPATEAAAAGADSAPGGEQPASRPDPALALLRQVHRAARAGRRQEALELMAQYKERYARDSLCADRGQILRRIEQALEAR